MGLKGQRPCQVSRDITRNVGITNLHTPRDLISCLVGRDLQPWPHALEARRSGPAPAVHGIGLASINNLICLLTGILFIRHSLFGQWSSALFYFVCYKFKLVRLVSFYLALNGLTSRTTIKGWQGKGVWLYLKVPPLHFSSSPPPPPLKAYFSLSPNSPLRPLFSLPIPHLPSLAHHNVTRPCPLPLQSISISCLTKWDTVRAPV